MVHRIKLTEVWSYCACITLWVADMCNYNSTVCESRCSKVGFIAL